MPETARTYNAEVARETSSPDSETPSTDPKVDAKGGRGPFRSYFELLEEKYADEAPPQVVTPEPDRPPGSETSEESSRHARRRAPVSYRSQDPESVEPADDARVPKIRQTQALRVDRNLRWVVALAFLAGVLLTALTIFFLVEGDDEDEDTIGDEIRATTPRPNLDDEIAAIDAPTGSVTEIDSEEPPAPRASPPDPIAMSEAEPTEQPPAEPGEQPTDEPSAAPPRVPSETGNSETGNSETTKRTESEPAEDLAETPIADEEISEDEVIVATDAAYEPPRQVFTPQPSYPPAARESGEEGTVTVEGRVTVDGDVAEARVVRGVSPTLDRVALETFRTWQFQPARRGDTAVESPYRISFRFALDRRAAPPTIAPPSPPPSPPPDPGPAGTVDDPLPLGGDFTPPERQVSPLPSLPRGRAGDRGDLVLLLVVDTEGGVARVEVEKAVDPAVTQRAVEAVKRWRFRPATRNGEPVAVWHRLVLRI